eukprot:CAMPEP_0185744660 /NCGR_PEP_ID=MMETSP1174-20130828/2800_1 /TAXON_ID=35687 /ORGANISM="Dictyocha speculum, Strain CCMP1381" /LENGTH=712 /DNA_ID=CAMNT_0028418175 /DNA_START=19 /DNA_END=2157 /DNA_ORIENTATION=-
MVNVKKKLINDPRNVVEEMVCGMCAVHSDKLVRLEGFTVLLHRNINTIKANQVTLISGGGSGHEPAHAGYIGDGMLSGAVLGGVFASPSTTSVLAAIRAACGSHGVLLIVKNYTGDRINFGQALLVARTEGIIVEMVVVDDDCALPEGKGVTGGRGVAGTVLVHKAAGAAAAQGLPLTEVAAVARSAAAAVKTLATSMTTCTVPGTTPTDYLDNKTIEMGLGIHGEPGMIQKPWKPAAELVEDMLNVIASRLQPSTVCVQEVVNQQRPQSPTRHSLQEFKFSASSRQPVKNERAVNYEASEENPHNTRTLPLSRKVTEQRHPESKKNTTHAAAIINYEELSIITSEETETPAPPPAPPRYNKGDRPIVLMVNSLGGTPTMERYIVAYDALRVCRRMGFEPVRVMVGAFMTALEMQGISLSVLPVEGEEGALLLERIDRPTTAFAWTIPSTEASISNHIRATHKPMIMTLSPKCVDPNWVISPNAVAAIEAACDALEAAEPDLTAWDQIAGDGDCGITVQRGAVAVRAVAPMLAGMNAAKAYGAIADAVAGSMGGSLGALLEILFRAGRIHLLEDDDDEILISEKERRGGWACCGTRVRKAYGPDASSMIVDHSGALYAGTNAIMSIGGAEPGMRTMLDALVPAVEKLRKSQSRDDWKKAVRAAEEGAEGTLLMEGLAGRSNYINAELLKTVPDPGAKAVAIAFRAALEATSC